jgi:hypothetical protein
LLDQEDGLDGGLGGEDFGVGLHLKDWTSLSFSLGSAASASSAALALVSIVHSSNVNSFFFWKSIKWRNY